MHYISHKFLFALLIIMSFMIFNISAQKIEYPNPKKVDQVDDYHGTKVADPYRWLEETDSADSHAWIDAENKITANYMSQIPERQMIKDRITKLFNYEK